MVFDLIVSALVTVLVVMLTDGILTFFGNGLMNIGYRSAWIGPGGLRPSVRTMILTAAALLSFSGSYHHSLSNVFVPSLSHTSITEVKKPFLRKTAAGHGKPAFRRTPSALFPCREKTHFIRCALQPKNAHAGLPCRVRFRSLSPSFAKRCRFHHRRTGIASPPPATSFSSFHNSDFPSIIIPEWRRLIAVCFATHRPLVHIV